MKAHSTCPLCGAPTLELANPAREEPRYFSCAVCALIHLDRARRLSPDAERSRYLLHQNDRNDTGYVSFLNRLAEPVIRRLSAGARGLDFGCGPAPVLAEMLIATGFPCAAYDPFLAPDESLLKRRYDFITCSEVAEHAYDPAGLFETLKRILAPGGILGVMTTFHPGADAFTNWWYRRDPTHVCFYNEATMRWIGERHGWMTEVPRPNVTIFGTAAHP